MLAGLGEAGAARFRDRVLPVLGLFRSSRVLASEMPGSWLMTVDSGTIEQALARNDRHSAALLIRRHMERPLRGHQTWPDRIGGFRHGWESESGRDRPPQYGNPCAGLAGPRPQPARPHSENHHRNQHPARRHSSATPAGPAAPPRNGSDPLADGRRHPHTVLPKQLSRPRSAACPWLRSACAGQQDRYRPPGRALMCPTTLPGQIWPARQRP